MLKPERMRLSQHKAGLVKELTDADASKLLRAIQDYKYQGEVPSPDEELPGVTPASHPAAVFRAAKPADAFPAPFLSGDPGNVLVIPDLHAPYIREGFLEWLQQQQQLFNCGTVIAIGDLADQASLSYHEKNPDMPGQGEELLATRNQLKKLFHMFPGTATNPVFCCLGNHDLLIARKAKTIGLSAQYLRPFGEIFGAPTTWEFGYQKEVDNVVYTHGGAGGKADRMAKESRKSTVQGHFHCESYVQHFVSQYSHIFAMQVGSGQDDKALAFEYGKPFPKKSVVGCGVVLFNGTVPLTLTMPL